MDSKRRVNIQTALYEIADAASALTDMQTFYKRLHEIVGRLMYAKNFYVTLYDPVTHAISAPYFVDEAGDTAPPPSILDPSNKSLRGYVLLRGETLHVSGAEVEKGRRNGKFTPMGTPAVDWIGVPLKTDVQVIGMLTIQSYEKGIRYTNQDVRLLEFVARHIAVALSRARAIEETRQRNAELQIINSVQQGLGSKLDMQEIYDLVGDELRNIFKAQVVMISTYDHETETIEHRYAIERGERIYAPGHHPIRGFRTQIVQTRKSVLVNTNVAEEAARLGQPTLPGTITPKSWLGAPMTVDEKVTGILSLQNVEEENAFNEADVRLLETFAASMSVALENARLFGETQSLLKETEDRAAELQIVNSVQEALASNLDLQAIYELIGEKIRQVFHVQVVDIVSYDPATNLMSMPYSYEKGDRSTVSPREPYGFRLHVINSSAPLLINQNFVELASQYDNPLLTGAWPKSALFVPLLVEGKVKGVISMQDLDKENAFGPLDVQLLHTLSNAMSVAIENARLFDETQRLLIETEQRAAELATVNTVSAALVGELDLNALIELVGEQIRSIFKADIAFVALLDKENGMINFPYQYGEHHESLSLGHGLTSKIIQSGKPLLINQDMDRQREQMGVTRVGIGAQSFLGVPIFLGDESLGVLSVQNTKQEGLFTESDQRLLSTIAANVGIAFQNARLFDETQRSFQAEQRAHEQAETLRSVAQALNRSLSLTDVFDLVLTEIQKVIPYDSAAIYKVDENRRVLVSGRGFANLAELTGASFEFNEEEDAIGYTISRSLEPLILEDAPRSYPQYFGDGLHSATKIRSYMAVPIVLNQKLIGMITLDRETPGFYNVHHAGLALTFAAQAATAINNARLFDEVQKRNQEITEALEQQTATSEILSVIANSPTDVQPVFDAIVESAVKLCGGFAGFGYRVLDGKIHLVSQCNDPNYYEELQPSFPLPLDTLESESNVASVIRTCTMLHVEDQKTDPRIIPENRDYAVRFGVGSSIWIPLVKDGKGIGAIITGKHQVEPFTESQIALIKTFADQAVIAIENVRLFTETQRLLKETEQRNAELAIINSVQDGLASKLDMQGIYDLVGDKIREIFDVQAIQLVSFDHEKNLMHRNYLIEKGQRLYVDPLPISKVWAYFINNPRTTLLNSVTNFIVQVDPDFVAPPVGHTPRSLIAVPLMVNGELRGAIDLEDLDRENAFSESDVRLLETLADSMSVALENARLWEQEKMFRKALQRELEIGREIQAGFLPDALPQVEGWEIAASLMSAREVAGDFYDAFELPDGKVGLVVADVCDKGVGAALFMTLFRSLIRVTATKETLEHGGEAIEAYPSAERLTHAMMLTNDYIAETHGKSGMFATIFFGMLDPRTGVLTYVNGGHEPPLIIHSGLVREYLPKTGPAVGVIAGVRFSALETRLDPGDTFFAYTDGVTEAMNPQEEFFGHERLREVISLESCSSQAFIAGVESRLRQYIGHATQFDDITLLAVRRDNSIKKQLND